MNISDVRQQLPELAGLDDDQVVDAIHGAYYPDLSRDDVAKHLGYSGPSAADAPAPERSFLGTVGDTAISLGKGMIAVPEAAVGLADIATGGRVGKALEDGVEIPGTDGFRLRFDPKAAKGVLDEGLSDAQKHANKQVMEAEGLWETIKAAVRNPSVAAQSAVESIPLMGAGGLVARGLAAAGARGALAVGAGEGVAMAGGAAEQIRQQTPDGLLTGEQSALAGATGAAGAAFGALGAKIAAKLGLADVDALISGAATNPKAAKGIVRQVLEGAASEGILEELPQSVSEQVLQNIALGRPIDEGVNQAAVLGTMAGGLMGGAVNLYAGAKTPAPSSPGSTPAPTPGQIMDAPSVDSAIDMAVQAVTPSITGTSMADLLQRPATGGGMLGAEPELNEALTFSGGQVFEDKRQEEAGDIAVDKMRREALEEAQSLRQYEPLKLPRKGVPTIDDIVAPGDILTAKTGAPFTAAAAKLKQKALRQQGKEVQLIEVAEGGYLLRPITQGATHDDTQTQPAGAGRADPVSAPVPAGGPANLSDVVPPVGAVATAAPVPAAVRPDPSQGSAAGAAPAGVPGDGSDRVLAGRDDGAASRIPVAPAAKDAASVAENQQWQRALLGRPDGTVVKGADGRHYRIQRLDGQEAHVQVQEADGNWTRHWQAGDNKGALKDLSGAAIVGSIYDFKPGHNFFSESTDAKAATPAPAPTAAAPAGSSQAPGPDAPGDGTAGQAGADAAADQQPALSGEQDRNGLRAEDRYLRSLDSAASELAGQVAENSADDDFDPSEVRKAVADWARDAKVAADDLRAAFIKQLGAVDMPAPKRKAIIKALDPTNAQAAEATEAAPNQAGAPARGDAARAPAPAPAEGRAGGVEAAGVKGKRPTYAQRKVLNAQAIIDWAKSQGFEKTLPAEDMHVTIAYSKTAMDPLAVGNQSPAYQKGVITGKAGREVAPLGDEGAIVLKFASPVLSTRWAQFNKAGASWDYEGYQPHVTITYDAGDVDLSKVQPYLGPIELGPELVEALDDSPGTPKEEPTQALAQTPAQAPDPGVIDQPRDQETGQFVAEDEAKGPYAQWRDSKPAQRRELLRAAGYTDADQSRALSGTNWSQLTDPVRRALSAAPKATPQVPNESGTKYVLPSFVAGGGKKETKAIRELREAEEARAKYFTPGNVVRSYAGFDEVLAYSPPKEPGGAWSVRVHEVREVAPNQWHRVGRPQDSRQHSTQPEERLLKNGPRAQLPALAAFEVPYTEQRGDGRPHSNAEPRSNPRATAAPAPITTKPAASTNTVFTDDMAEKARARLKAKLGRTSSGLDPEMMLDGITLAGWHIEKNARTFAAFAKAMLEDLGEGIRPHLKSLYMAVKYSPQAAPFSGQMSSAAFVEEFDLSHVAAPSDSATPGNTDTGGQDGTSATRNLDRTGTGAPEGAPASAVRAPDAGRDAGAAPAAGGPGDQPGDSSPDAPGRDLAGGVGAGAGDLPVPARGGRGQRADTKTRGVSRAPRPDAGAGLFDDAGREGAVNPAPNAPPIAHNQPTAEALADFTIEDDLALGEGGQKTKFKNNMAAIRLAKELMEAPRPITSEEQRALALYVGWGGLPQAFDAANADWAKEHAELKEVLSDAEFDAARRSTRYAHYTSREIIQDGIYAALRRFGFTGGRVIEGGAGVGNFIGLMPVDMRSAGRVTAIEREPIAATIARHLYPQQNVQLADFTEFKGQDGYFDAAVGNPPFASDTQVDKSGRKHLNGLSLHNYFFAKEVDLLREGGILAQVVSNYFMDAVGDRSRKYIGERTRFLGAIRLPNNAFAKNANTEVTTDIIFLQKLPEAEWGGKKAKAEAAQWLQSSKWTDAQGREVLLNQYFQNHPIMMLGDFGAHGTMYGPDQPALIARPGQDTAALLREAIENLPQNVYQSAAVIGTSDAVDAAVRALTNPPVQEGGYYLEGDKLIQRLPDIAGEARGKDITPETQWTAKTTLGVDGRDRIVRLAQLRTKLRELLAAELKGDKAMEALRTRLNQEYDGYTKAHGLIGDRGTARVFDDDPDFPLLLSLEHNYVPPIGPAEAKKLGIKTVKSKADKAPIFRQRVVDARKTVRKVETPADALAVSMAERGRLDTAYIGQLLGKSPEDVLSELSSGDKPLLFLDPATNEYALRDAYLSGNVRAKLAQAKEANLFGNVRALEAVQPEDVGAHQISAKIGAPWVPTSVYEDFARELLGEEAKVSITYMKLNSSYSLYASGASEVNETNKWGTASYKASELLSALLNNRTIKVTTKDAEGRTIVLQEATENANTKAQEIKDRFSDWLFADAERSELLVRAYNDTNNNYVTREYDGSWMTFPGKVPDSVIKFRRHQRNAIARTVQDRTLLMDHVVGAGKTFTIVAGAMELRRTGLARKPMIVVPNHLVKQWAADFYRLYPGANILTATKKDFEKINRRRFLAKIATGNWDAVVMAHSSFGFIQPGAEFEAEFNERQIKLIMEAINDVAESDAEKSQKKRTIKQLEAMSERLEKRIEKLRHKPMDSLLDFEELGVDQLFIDEAHSFKNLMFTTKLQGVAGLGDSQGSQRAYDMYVKTQEVTEKNGRGQGVVFATGTPVSNSLAEKYHMLRYLMPRQMEELGFQSFDAWANTYAEVNQVWMQKPSGDGFKAQNRMSQFSNVHELLKLFDQVADTVTIDDIKRAYKEENEGKEFPIPPLKTGRRQPVSLDKSPAQEAYMEEIAKRAKAIEARKGPPQKGEDNVLVLMTDARKAAMDIRLVDMDRTEREPGGRIDRAAAEIMDRYTKYAKSKGTQLVFSDMGTPIKNAKAELKEYEAIQARVDKAIDEVRERAALGADDAQMIVDDAEDAEAELDAKGPDWLTAVKAALRGFSVYDDLKAALIERGIPEHEIAFIHDYNSDEQKAGLYRKMNAGDIRVLVGSTQKLGAGTNVQARIVALHHLDVPWRPSDVEQREGRALRQGNLLFSNPDDKSTEIPGFEVEILAYVTKDTLDMRMWQIQEVKLKLINQLRSRQIERDIDNAFEDMEMSAGEMQAAATGNMDLLLEIQAKNDIKKLEQKRRSFEAQKNDLISRRKSVKQRLERLPKEIQAAEEEEALAKQYNDELEAQAAKFKVTIDGKEYTDPKAAGEYLLEKTDAKHFTRTVEKDDKKVREELPSADYAKLADSVQRMRDDGVTGAKLDEAVFELTSWKEQAAPLDVEMNGERYTARARLAEAFSDIRGDRDPILWKYKGQQYSRRTAAVNAIRQEVADAIADEREVNLGTVGPFTLTAEGQPADKLGNRGLDLVLAAGDKKIEGFISIGQSAEADKVAEQAINWADRKAKSAGGNKQYLTWDLEAAKKQQAELDKTEDLAQWPDQEKLEVARKKHQEILGRLGKSAPKEGEAPAFKQDMADAPSIEQRRAVGELQQLMDGITENWAKAPTVTVVASIQSPAVPAAIREAAATRVRSGGGNAKGVFYQGQVYLFADKIRSEREAATVLLHEVAGHWGLRQTFGAELGRILDQVVLLRRKDVDAMLKRTGMNSNDPANLRRAAEEVLAYMAQEQPQLGLVRRAVAAIRAWLRDALPGVFGNIELTDDEIIFQFLIPARNYLGGGPNGPGGGIEPSPAFAQKYDAAQKAEAVRRYESGERAAEVAADMGIKLPTMYDWMRAAGVELRGRELEAQALAAESRAEIVRRYEAGESTPQLAREFNVHASTVSAYLKEAGVERRKPGPSAEMVAEAKRLYESGLSLEKVADQLAVHGSAVFSWLRNAGVTLRPRAGHSAELKDEALRLYADGMSTNAIADRLEVNATSVYEWVKAAGTIRSQSEATSIAIQNGRPVYSGINTPWQSTKTGRWEMANSTYELLRMGQLDADADVVSWGKKTPLIAYTDAAGKSRTYVPDFLIEYADGRRVVEEVKPAFQLESATVKAKHAAAREQLAADGIEFRVVTQNDIGADDIKEAYRHLRIQRSRSDAESDKQQPLFAQGFNTRQVQVDGKWRPIDAANGRPVHASFQGQVEFWRRYASRFPLDAQGRPRVEQDEVQRLLDADGFTPMFAQEGVLPASEAGNLNDPRDYKALVRGALAELGNTPGKLHWWHRSIGTQYNLAQRSKPFKRVFDGVQDFLSDVSLYATEVANKAPSLLPKLETWRDIAKTPLSAADTKAIAAPIFDGTLAWTRFEGKPIKVDDLKAMTDTWSDADKAQAMMAARKISPEVIKMWQGLPNAQYQAALQTAFENRMLKPGIVFAPAELKKLFKLTDAQVGYYQEFRAATDQSITDLSISDMVRYAGQDAAAIREQLLGLRDIGAAAAMLRAHLMDKIDAQPDREADLTQTINKIQEKAAKAQELIEEGYAPLSRFGHYTVDVVDVAGERQFFSLYESRFEAERAAAAMRKEFPGATVTRGTLSEEEYKLFAGVSPETVELFGEMLGLDATGDAAKDAAFQAYLKLAKANRSSMKRLIHRKGIAGFSQDVGRVLAGFTYSNARMTSRNLHAGDIEQAISEIPKGQGELKDQAIRLRDYVHNPVEEAQALRGLLFAQYLGGSIAAALVNMSQPFQVTMPYLSQYVGVGGAARQLRDALKVAWAKTTGDAGLDKALLEAAERGVVAPQEIHDLMKQAAGTGGLKSGDGTTLGNAAAAANNALSRLTLAWGKPFSTAELFNRRVTFVAAYRTAVEKGMSDPAAFAEETIRQTQFIYNKGNKPQWARGAMGSVLFTFKTYSISYMELLHRMATAGEPGSPERAAGQRAALFAMAMLLMMGGAGGLPFVEDVSDLVDGVMQRLGYNFSAKQKRQQLLEEAFGRGLGHVLDKGVSGLPGVPIDIANRLGLGNLIPGTGMLQKKTDRTRDVTDLAGPVGDLATRVVSAVEMAAKGDVVDAGLEVSPVAARNLAKAIEMSATGIYDDKRGYKVLDVTGADALAKGIGFNPSAVATVQEGDRQIQQMIALARMRESEIAAQWAKAIVDGDADGVIDAREAIALWNFRNPESPIRIRPQDVLKRARNMRKSRAERLESSAPKEVRSEVRRQLQERD